MDQCVDICLMSSIILRTSDTTASEVKFTSSGANAAHATDEEFQAN